MESGFGLGDLGLGLGLEIGITGGIGIGNLVW